MPMTEAHLDAAGRRNLRWSVIKVAKEAGRNGVLEDVVYDAIIRAGMHVTLNQVREAANYVEGHDFVTIAEGDGQWVFTITTKGIDLCDYEATCPKSIGRPPKYW